MRVKGLRVDWRDWSERGFVDARRGRRDVKSKENIIDSSSSRRRLLRD